MIANYEAAEKIQMDNLSALRQSHLEGIEIGREEGREEGAHQNALRNAHKMKEIGITNEQIMLVTGLSKQEIETLT